VQLVNFTVAAYVPSAQSTHIDPLSYLPAKQSTHSLDAAILPASHLSHLTLSGFENKPAEHGTHKHAEAAPVTAMYCPAKHSLQLEAPCESLNIP